MKTSGGEERSIDVTVGANIRKLRTRASLTQEGLVAKLEGLGWKIDASALARIELGQRSLRLPQLKLVADALGETLIDMIYDDVDALTDRRLRAHSNLHQARRSLATALEELEQITFADEELLARSFGDTEPAPDYLDGVREAVKQWTGTATAPRAWLFADENTDKLRAIAEALIGDLIDYWTRSEGDSYALVDPREPADRGVTT